MGALNRDSPQLDVRNIVVALKRRWWIVPLCMVIGAGVMFAQESDLQTTPAYATVTSYYETRDETLGLSVFGISPNAVNEYPSFQTQIRLIGESAALKVEQEFGKPIGVKMTKIDPRVSLINGPTDDSGQQFTVMSVGVNTYEYRCDADTVDICNQVIDIYVAETVAQRKASISEGMKRLAAQIALVEQSAQSSELRLQQEALLGSAEMVTGEVTFVSTRAETYGLTMSTVDKTTYAFGAAAGLLVALLIILQLAILDKKVRSAGKLGDQLPHVALLGQVNGHDDASMRHMASALVAQAKTHGANSLLLVPASGAAAPVVGLLGQLATGVRVVVGKCIDEMTVEEMSSNAQTCVVVVTKHETDVRDVQRTESVLRQAGNTVAGMMLIDAHD
jgi:hypothetical protein